jgi:hypothetical protein
VGGLLSPAHTFRLRARQAGQAGQACGWDAVPQMVDNPLWEICERVCEVQMLLDDRLAGTLRLRLRNG